MRAARTLEKRVARVLWVISLFSFFFSIFSTSNAVAGPRCAAPASDPTVEEVVAAMRVVGLPDDAPVPVAKAIQTECFSGTELALYDRLVRVILLGDDWREVGGLTRLIHEMKHYADDLAGLRGEDECGASRIAAAWADDHNYFNEARRERRYGAASCSEGGALVARALASPSGGSGDSGRGPMTRTLQAASVMFLPPDD
jgi:hypothetical protein